MLDTLNEGQRRAATTDGNVLVLSPAGSGKTKTVQAAIVRILAAGYSPDGVLAVTFTNKAADELLARVRAAVGESSAKRMTACTFHSYCARLLRSYADTIGRTPSFTIYDETDAKALAHKIAHEMGVAPGNYGRDAIRKKIAKKDPDRARTFDALYREALLAYNAVDFDDLESGALDVLRRDPRARDAVGLYHHIIVDEYQDTSPEQKAILDEMQALAAARGAGVSMLRVGDPAQSIYGFRGADVRNILALATEPGVEVVHLPTNYRSGTQIVALSNVLAPLAGSPLTDVRSGHDFEGVVRIEGHETEAEGGEAIAASIAGSTFSPGDHMILARTWRDLEPVYRGLLLAEVPAVYARGNSDRWNEDTVRYAVAVLRLACNPLDILALRAVARWSSEAISDGELARAEADLTARDPVERFAEVSPRFVGVLRARQLVEQHAREGFRSYVSAADVFQAYLQADESGAVASLDARGVAGQRQIRATLDLLGKWGVERLNAGGAVPNPRDVSPQAFLQWYSTRALREQHEDEHDPKTGPVRLMTVHAAKGLQAAVVHVVGLESGFWPGNRPDTDHAEEWRVFYVAATRAEHRLVFHHAARRRATWSDTIVEAKPSPLIVPVERFLRGLGGEPVEVEAGSVGA